MYSCICFFARLFPRCHDFTAVHVRGGLAASVSWETFRAVHVSWWSTVHPQTTTPPQWREPTRDRLADARLGRRGAKAPAFSSVDQKQCVCRGGGRVILCERLVDTT